MKRIIPISMLMLTMLNLGLADTTSCTTVDCAILAWIPQMNSVEDVIGTIAYIIGVIFVYKSIMKFKENNESKGQVKLSVAIMYFIAGGLLLGLPSVIKTGRATVGVTATYDTQSQTGSSY